MLKITSAVVLLTLAGCCTFDKDAVAEGDELYSVLCKTPTTFKSLSAVRVLRGPQYPVRAMEGNAFWNGGLAKVASLQITLGYKVWSVATERKMACRIASC